ncbi:MAG: 3-methyl-2-oxobutanoate hydroxymethyltransferase [Planctomycetes bacterium]|nr:3-methyl-2-oxobutanoate hydroxymethyltransferase [Planctomycetota bacterium]
MAAARERIVVLTAYDHAFARLLDEAGVDVLLVGDSLGMVVQGEPTTLTVTLDHMVYHTQLVARAARRAMVVADMPFLSYQTGPVDALRSAGRLVQEGRAQAVKLEGGRSVLPQVQAIVDAGVPVMGHLGLTPQSVHQFGSYRTRGTDPAERARILTDASALEEAGAFSIVLEKIPADLAAEVTQRLSIPTIGIGAGPHCAGQVLVVHDLLGLFDAFRPRFVRRYRELGAEIRAAVSEYAADVRAGTFPGPDETAP